MMKKFDTTEYGMFHVKISHEEANNWLMDAAADLRNEAAAGESPALKKAAPVGCGPSLGRNASRRGEAVS